MADEAFVRQVRAIGWSDVASAEATLLERCALGDERAYTELVQEHQRMVSQLAMHLLGDPEEALDLCQEVFLRVFRTLHTFRGQAALRTWIYRIVINQARNRQRWWHRRRRADQVSFEVHVRTAGEPSAAIHASAPDHLLDRKVLSKRIRAALAQLPFDQRSAIVLREVDGLRYEEIAFSLGVAVGTVKSRLARAREALRADLRDLWTG